MTIQIVGLQKRFALPGGRPLQILAGVDLDVRPGRTVAIVGRSGSGKSTLLNIVGLLDQFDGGSYSLGGVDVSLMSERDRSLNRGRTFGFVFQQFFLLEGRTALENVAAPLAHATPAEYRTRHHRATEVLAAVGLADRSGSLPSQLSGGEQQRVAIARALVRRPQIILADEPTGSLDTTTGAEVLRLLLRLVGESGSALVLVTHDSVLAAAADRRLRLEGGRLVPE